MFIGLTFSFYNWQVLEFFLIIASNNIALATGNTLMALTKLRTMIKKNKNTNINVYLCSSETD